MELNVLKINLCHLQHIAAVGQEHIAALHIGSHKLVLALFECLKFGLIVALYPAGLVKAGGLPTAQGVVLMLQTVLDNLKLKLTYSTYKLAAVKLVHEHLGNTLTHKLVNTLGKLLGAHGIGVLNVFEHLGRETGQALEMELFTLSESITYLEVSGIRQAYDIARPGLLDGALALCHELGGRRKTECLVQPYMVVRLVTLKTA